MRKSIEEIKRLLNPKECSKSLNAKTVLALKPTVDSRNEKNHEIFICLKGSKFDGHDYLEDAYKNNAKLLVLDDLSYFDRHKDNLPCLLVPSSRRAWGALEAENLDNPQKQLKIHGITGTNGKTSTAWMLSQLLNAAGVKNLFIGTLGIYFGNERHESNHTTLDPDVFFEVLRKAVDFGYTDVCMEVSSHAVVQEKISNVSFTSKAITSFSQDHLDFHKSMENYWAAKKSFITRDEDVCCYTIAHKALRENLKDFSSIKFYEAPHFKPHPQIGEKTQFRILYQNLELKGSIPYIGNHNQENFTAAFLIASTRLGKPIDPRLWENLDGIPGRLEKVNCDRKDKPLVYIDFAHTPDAFSKTIGYFRSSKKDSQKILIVFGCGGERDQSKRPKMGAISENLADICVVTNDNPRGEAPTKIVDMILSGFRSPEKAILIHDRKKAIEWALSNARSNDIVLILGKGHENYQIQGNRKIPFSDFDTALNFLNKG